MTVVPNPPVPGFVSLGSSTTGVLPVRKTIFGIPPAWGR
jgi:hypothetical protein